VCPSESTQLQLIFFTSTRIVTSGFRVGEPSNAAVSRRPPIFIHTIVVLTHRYAAKLWDFSSIVQGPFSVAPVPNLSVSQLSHGCAAGEVLSHGHAHGGE
jgi:hypothetical protein